MWKIAVGFIAFAALALFILSRGGDIDMSGEKHGTETAPATSAPASASVAPAAAIPASAASAPGSAPKP